MNKLLLGILSFFLIILSIVLQLYGIFTLVTASAFLGALYFLIGISIGILAKTLKNLELFPIRLCLSLGILFLSLALFLYPLSEQAEPIAESIQPSIDQAMVIGVKDIVERQIEGSEMTEMKVLLGTGKEIRTLNAANLSKEDLELISEVFELEELTQKQQELFAKLLIEQVNSITKEQDIPLPLSETKRQLDNLGIDLKSTIQGLDTETLQTFCSLNEEERKTSLSTLKSSCQSNPDLLIVAGLSEQAQACRDNPQYFDSLNPELISNFCSEDSNASIRILLFAQEEIRTINIQELSEEEVQLIWDNLGFPTNLSIETKENLIKLFFGLLEEELTNQEDLPKDYALPLASIGEAIPSEFEALLNYDLFANNIEDAAQALSNLREECKEEALEENELCEGILLTEYDTLMASEQLLNQESSEEFPLNLSSSAFDPLRSTETIEESLETTGSYYFHFLFTGLVLLLLAIFLSQRHFVKEYEEFHKLKAWKNTLAFFSKNTLIAILPYTLFLAIPYFLLKDGFIFSFIPLDDIEGLEQLPEILGTLPLILEFTTLFGQALLYTASLFFLLLLLTILGFCLRYQESKIQVKSEE